MMYCLCKRVSRVVRLHKAIRSAQLNAVSGRHAQLPEDAAVAADLAESQLPFARQMLGG